MAVEWSIHHIAEFKNVNILYVGGSPAGAWLTAMLAFAPQFLGRYGIKTTDIVGYIFNSAQMTTHFNVLRERGIHANRNRGRRGNSGLLYS